MMRILIPLLLVLAATAQHAVAQFESPDAPVPGAALDGDSPKQFGVSPDTARAESALTKPVTASPLAARKVLVARERTNWKVGAVVGGIVGGGVGFGFGIINENLINEGSWSVGSYSLGTALLGATGGALVGALIGSMIPR